MIIKTRVIPVLLLQDGGLVKTIKFKNPTYVGDPINSVRIFNEKEVDELVFLDINATPENRGPDFDLLRDIAGEAFMPMAYGGGIRSFEDAKTVLGLGFEKVIVNTLTHKNPEVIREIVSVYGAQSVVACIDVKSSLIGGPTLFTHSGATKIKTSLDSHLKNLTNLNIGEIIINSIDRDGTQFGYDVKTLKRVTSQVDVPTVACGGAKDIESFVEAVNQGGCSATAAGTMFVFRGKHRAVLISYPERKLLVQKLP
ncbi:MAG: AglZ/HisF2 family acetamidino modification protein [Roseibium sp.]